MNLLHFYLLVYIYVDGTFGYPLDEISNTLVQTNSSNDSGTTIPSEIDLDCSKKVIDSEDVTFLENGRIFLHAYNATISPTNFIISNLSFRICLQPTDELKKNILDRCEKFADEKENFSVFPNGSVVLYEQLLENVIFDINEAGKLVRCAPDYDEIPEEYLDEARENFNYSDSEHLSDEDKISSIIGIVGSCISVLALLLHITVFCLVPSKNLPGYYLLSLSIAFLMAYFFVLFGQIPDVLGTSCIASAILQQYFFLVAFFWTNVMAFDVWKMLKMATTQLMLSTEVSRRRQFLWYSLYAWLVPLSIIVGAVAVEYTESISNTFKPQYGKGNICWINNDYGKGVFFLLPAITIFVVNAVFFTMSAIIIKRNPIKEPGYQTKQTAKVNLVLYIRLVIMMGITWLIGVIGVVSRNFVIMCIADIFNSLQGLFLFLLFSCCKKVLNHLRDRLGATQSKTEFDKNTTDTTKYDSK